MACCRTMRRAGLGGCVVGRAIGRLRESSFRMLLTVSMHDGIYLVWFPVSILVLLDAARSDNVQTLTESETDGFNPCSSGCCSLGGGSLIPRDDIACFNPCSSGCCSLGLQRRVGRRGNRRVSILVLLDAARSASWPTRTRPRKCVSILVLLDAARSG